MQETIVFFFFSKCSADTEKYPQISNSPCIEFPVKHLNWNVVNEDVFCLVSHFQKIEEKFSPIIFSMQCVQLRIIYWEFIKYSCCPECKYYCMKYRQRLQLNIVPYIQFVSLNLIAIMRFQNTCFDRIFLFFQFDMLEARFDCNHLE